MGSMGKKFAVIVGASALALAACSSDSDDSSDSDSGGDTVASQYDLGGVDLAIGSKDFDEQLILGQMMVQAYEAAGANVDDKVNLGGTAVAREALLSGEIDMYMEYNGTGWTVHLGQEDPSFDPEELTSGVRDLDAENGIVWGGSLAVQQHVRLRFQPRSHGSQRWRIHSDVDDGVRPRQPGCRRLHGV